MAERYRDQRGHFISREQALSSGNYLRELFERGQRGVTFRERVEGAAPRQPAGGAPGRGFLAEEPSELRTAFLPNWEDTDNEYATTRQANGEVLTPDAFDNPPSDAQGFQVRFIVPSSPDYPRGWASYAALTIDEWSKIQDILDDGRSDFDAKGVGAIVFYRTAPQP